jgi:DHA1 family tetracycline resistance protein-like MFS transporter
LPLLVGDNFHLDSRTNEASATTVAYLFVYCGLIGALVQGGAIGRMVRKFGEPKLIAISLILTGISLGCIPFIKGNTQLSWGVLFHAKGLPWLLLLGALAMLSIGSSLTRPPLFGLLSNLTSEHEQGATIGVAQGAGSLARIIGPIFASTTLHFVAALPYITCTAILLTTSIMVMQKLCRQNDTLLIPSTPDTAK